MEKIDLPRKTVYRLSLYQRSLQKFIEQGVDTVSSEDLARASGVKPTQLRKDLGHVGQYGVRMAIVAVPEASGQSVADILVESGVQAILNFSPAVLSVPDDVVVNHVDLAAELGSLSFFVS